MEEKVRERTKELEISNEQLTKENIERKRIEEALLETTNRLELSLKAAIAGTWDWNVVSGEIIWSQEMFGLFGLDALKATASFDTWRAVLHPDDIEMAEFRITDALEKHINLQSDYRVVLPDGSIRWINSTGEGLYDAAGQAVRMIGICQDITERKNAEGKLRTSEEKFRAVAELSPIAIYSSTGSNQQATYINEAFYKIFGFSMEDVPTVGEWWIKAFPEETYRKQIFDKWAYNIEQAAKNNTDVEALECVCRCKDGSDKIIIWIGKTIGDEFWAYGYDISEREKAIITLKESEEKIKNQLNELQRWQNVMLGREDRIKELKVEVNEILIRLGEAIRYPSQSNDT